MSADLPVFTPTSVDKIPVYVQELRDSFNAGKTRDLDFRISQLRRFYWALKDREEKFLAAVKKDLNKSAYETLLTEFLFVLNDIIYASDNLKKWAKPEKLDGVDFTFSIMKPVARKDPLGTVLVIGAYNFPFQLTLIPVIGAIAAGNTVVLKPSEVSPRSAAIIQEAMEASLDPSCYRCIQGAIPETQALLAQKWDKICYTGGERVAKIVAQAAVQHLTPLLLELGGKNPAFVTKNANVKVAARRLAWGKCTNAGQVCLSQNYMLVDKEVVDT
ncbi:40S ribosomal protein S12, partial [Ascosphaera pollenicola]